MPLESSTGGRPHLVVVDTYDGIREHLYDYPGALREALGLPLAAIAEQCDLNITVLNWRDWLAYEQQKGSFLDWMPFPATRPAAEVPVRPAPQRFDEKRISIWPVPTRDPAFRSPLKLGLSPLSFGLLADSDPLFLMSYILNDYLEEIHVRKPIAAVILPMFGGLGYVAQLSRATGAGLPGVRFGVVVTDTSKRRQEANGEGLWTRPAITRRQMEDMSLALSDLAICYGPRGEAHAKLGIENGAIVRAPRYVDGSTLNAISRSGDKRSNVAQLQFSIDAPRQPSSGTLALLDAARILRDRAIKLDHPICCGGTNMTFGPSKPRDFTNYWSSRGWVREIVEAGYWRWSFDSSSSESLLQVSVCPSLFDHLPSIWSELARDKFVILSPAAAEGLAEEESLPSLTVLHGEPTPDSLADRVAELQALGAHKIDAIRHELCRNVASHLRSDGRQQLLVGLCGELTKLVRGSLMPPSLGAAARLLLDRKGPLQSVGMRAPQNRYARDQTLTVAIACYEMGELLLETVRSVWRSRRLPDEVVIVDDGSSGEPTVQALEQLRREAAENGLPLSIVRQNNRGLAAARNRALAAARSSYISFLDGDDLIHPDFYALALKVLVDNPQLGGVAAWAETFGQGVPDGFWNAPQAELPLLLVENTVIVPCVMPTEVLRSLGGYDEEQRYNYEDWELAVRLLAAGRPIITIPRYLQRYRVRNDSLLRTMSDVQNQVMRERLFARHRDLCMTFAPEVALQIEHRLFLCSAAAAATQRRPLWRVVTGNVYAHLRRLGLRSQFGRQGRELL